MTQPNPSPERNDYPHLVSGTSFSSDPGCDSGASGDVGLQEDQGSAVSSEFTQPAMKGGSIMSNFFTPGLGQSGAIVDQFPLLGGTMRRQAHSIQSDSSLDKILHPRLRSKSEILDYSFSSSSLAPQPPSGASFRSAALGDALPTQEFSGFEHETGSFPDYAQSDVQNYRQPLPRYRHHSSHYSSPQGHQQLIRGDAELYTKGPSQPMQQCQYGSGSMAATPVPDAPPLISSYRTPSSDSVSSSEISMPPFDQLNTMSSGTGMGDWATGLGEGGEGNNAKRKLSSKRTQQNRENQRAFRARKSQHVQEMDKQTKAFELISGERDSLQSENNLLRQMVLKWRQRCRNLIAVCDSYGMNVGFVQNIQPDYGDLENCDPLVDDVGRLLR